MISALLPAFFAVLLLGLPIFAALALSVFIAIEFFSGTSGVIVPMRMFTGMNNFSLMAIPFFILAAELMRIGGLSDRLINLAKVLVGWVPGGLGAATVLSCLLFGSISGSSPATVVAIGSIMFPALVAAGYSKHFSIGLIATAGTLGPIVPPSIALIIYGSVTGTSVGKLFAAGLLPPLFISSLLLPYCLVSPSFPKFPLAPFPLLDVLFTSLPSGRLRSADFLRLNPACRPGNSNGNTALPVRSNSLRTGIRCSRPRLCRTRWPLRLMKWDAIPMVRGSRCGLR